MARFYGTLKGHSKLEATKTGHADSGLWVSAQSWKGSVIVYLYSMGSRDFVHIGVAKDSSRSIEKTIYKGPIEALIDGVEAGIQINPEVILSHQCSYASIPCGKGVPCDTRLARAL